MTALRSEDAGSAVASGGGKNSLRLWAIFSFAVLIGAVILAPVSIGSRGFFPRDDAPRHVAKAIAGKPWNAVLVLRDDITTDMHHGWHAFLTAIHKLTGADRYALLALCIAFCFIVFVATPFFFLKRPEAWVLILLLVTAYDVFFIRRYFLGRPFLISCVVQCFIYLTWLRLTGPRPPWRWMAVLAAVFAGVSWLAPTSTPLFSVMLVGFAVARQWDALLRLTSCIIVGGSIGYCLTGYPLRLAHDVAFMIFFGPDRHELSRLLVGEFQPQSGKVIFLFCLAALLLLRVVLKRWNSRVIVNPLFINAVIGIVLGHVVGRFWMDWGVTAALVWCAVELDALLDKYSALNSIRRFALSAAAALVFFIVLTSDVASRWTFNVPRYPVILENTAPEGKQWFPDSGGIMYNTTMTGFYQGFFDNPKAPWRYVLGFEPALMRPEDLRIYRAIQLDENNPAVYDPWIDKMRPCDRMVLYTFGGQRPRISRLEWRCMNRNTWFGRLPRPDTSAAGTVRAGR